MGSNYTANPGGYDRTGQDTARGLLALSTLGISEYQPTGSNGQAVGNDAGRTLLAAATSGTSEIKTGGGQYGDETVADSLYPKTINDALSNDRTNARKAADAAAMAPPAVAARPDSTDALLSQKSAGDLIRMRYQTRRSSFLAGPDGEMSTPANSGIRSSMLGGNY